MTDVKMDTGADAKTSFLKLIDSKELIGPLSAEPGYEAKWSQLEIILSNLLGNAVDHSPKDGHVRCSVKAVETRVLITIANTSAGLDREDLPRLTERFWRKDSVRRAGGPAHVGLGLSMVKELTLQLGLDFDLRIDGDELAVVLGVPLDGA